MGALMVFLKTCIDVGPNQWTHMELIIMEGQEVFATQSHRVARLPLRHKQAESQHCMPLHA